MSTRGLLAEISNYKKSTAAGLSGDQTKEVAPPGGGGIPACAGRPWTVTISVAAIITILLLFPRVVLGFFGFGGIPGERSSDASLRASGV